MIYIFSFQEAIVITLNNIIIPDKEIMQLDVIAEKYPDYNVYLTFTASGIDDYYDQIRVYNLEPITISILNTQANFTPTHIYKDKAENRIIFETRKVEYDYE